MLNFLFSRFKFYREWKGGKWWLMKRCAFELTYVWRNISPDEYEIVIDSEDYTCPRLSVLPDCEFYSLVAKIPVNGEWKYEHNLLNFLNSARVLRQRGLEDKLIIDLLSTVLQASAREHVLLKGISYSGDEIMKMVELSKELR
jgi:hypothetical protein